MPDPIATPPANISASPDAPTKSDRPFPNFDFTAPDADEVPSDDGEVKPETQEPPAKERKKPGPKPKAKPEPTPEPEPDSDDEENDLDPESPEPDSDDEPEEEEDYDAPPKAKVAEEVDLDIVPETIARQQAKENGRKVKELSTRITEIELERNREKEELAETKKQLENFKNAQIDPRSHPEYQKITAQIWTDVEEVELELPEGKFPLRDKFSEYVHAFRATKGLPIDERRKALNDLKVKIVDQVGNFDSPYDELLDDEKAAAERISSKVLDSLKRNSGSIEKLDELAKDIKSKAQNGQLERGVEDYTRQATAISSVLQSIEAISEDAIDADPYAPESVVAKMVKGDEAQKRRFKNVEKDITEAFVGPRPLTQTELDALEAQGKDLKTFHKERQKQSEAKRQKLAAFLAQSLMTRAEDKAMRKELAELKAKYEGEESELDALDKVKPKKSTKVEPQNEYSGPARSRPIPSVF